MIPAIRAFTEKQHVVLSVLLSTKPLTLENTKGAIKKGQSRENGSIGYTRRRKTKQKHNIIYVGYYYTQTNTNNVNKTWTLLQTTRGKDEPNIVFFCGNRNGHHNRELRT